MSTRERNYRNKRKAMHLTQSEIAAQAGCSTPMISLFENGKRVSETTLLNIRNAVDNCMKDLDTEEFLETLIRIDVLRLEDAGLNEKILLVDLMKNHLSKLEEELLRQKENEGV